VEIAGPFKFETKPVVFAAASSVAASKPVSSQSSSNWKWVLGIVIIVGVVAIVMRPRQRQ
jgi:hypothetical protein